MAVVRCIADALKGKGYHTCIVGKWHLGMLFNGEHNSGKLPVGTKVTLRLRPKKP